MQRWLSFQLYRRAQPCDHYYLKLCNEIYNLFRDEVFPNEELSMSEDQKMDLACFLVGYFVDVISGPGLWRAFTTRIEELYGRYLPFFDPGPEDYFPEEINPEDIYFLLWYFFSMVHYNDHLISPKICERLDQTAKIIEIFEREYETAPDNHNLKQLLQVIPEEYDFYTVREKLRWIMLDSWLHHFLRGEFVEMNKDLLPGKQNEPIPEETRARYMADAVDSHIHLTYTPLLAIQGKEWLAYILGKDHPLFESLLEMGEKKRGFYLYMGSENGRYLFNHIATGTELRIHESSMEIPDGSKSGKSIMYGGFVKWKNEWWFSGAPLVWGEDDRLINNERESEESKRPFKDPAVQREENNQIFKSFLDFNGGSPLSFVENTEAAKVFIKDLLAFHDRSARKPPGRGQNGQWTKIDGILGDIERRMAKPDIVELDTNPGREADEADVTTIPGMIFCNPETGIEMVFGYNDLIPDPRNKWYAGETNREKRTDRTIRLLDSSNISGYWIKYLAKNYELPGLDLPGTDGKDLLMKNFDFVLRFLKREEYYG